MNHRCSDLKVASPAGWLITQQPGRYVVGYRTNTAAIELEATKFRKDLLREEGLDAVVPSAPGAARLRSLVARSTRGR